MRLVLLLVALGLGGCLLPIADLDESASGVGKGGSNVGAGGGAGIVTSGWEAGAPGGTGGKSDAGPSLDAGADSGGDAAPGACSPLAAFVDDFEDNSPAPVWLPAAEGGAIWEEGAGALRVYLPSTVSPATFGGYRLEQSFDLAGCSLIVRVSQVPQSGGAVYTHFWLSYGAAGYAEFAKVGEGLQFRYWQSGMVQLLGAVGYDPGEHAYWRFAHDGTNLRWETSSNASDWELQASAPLPSTFSALRIGAGASIAKVIPVGMAAFFDELDVAPAGP